MTKQEALALFGSQRNLLRATGLTRQAIYQWPEEGDIPINSENRIRLVRPEAFVGVPLRFGEEGKISNDVSEKAA
jgi:hypothetical protein